MRTCSCPNGNVVMAARVRGVSFGTLTGRPIFSAMRRSSPRARAARGEVKETRMFRHAARWALLAIALFAGLVAPTAASAYSVTVHVHGAGKVDETTARNLMDCTTSSNVSESTVTDCVAGTPGGLYNSFD